MMGIFEFGEQRPFVIFLFRGRLDGSVSCERVCTLIRVAHSDSEIAMMMMIALVAIMLSAS
jgi:hypothetical protein